MSKYQYFHHHAFCLSILSIISITIFPSYASAITPTPLINQVCKKTSDYNFCVNSLYSDHRAADANNRTVLAGISFDLAYAKANEGRDHIDWLLKNATKSQSLDQCRGDYDGAVNDLVEAKNDLKSGSFGNLDNLANNVGGLAVDCHIVFDGHDVYNPLTIINHDLQGLSEICVVVAGLF